MISEARTWEEIRIASRCSTDDGAFAELFDEAIQKALDERWESLPELQEIVANDSRFLAFVLKHVSSDSIGRSSKERIAQAAKERCPDEAEGVCSEIARAIAIHSSGS
jgi:hypothetical protein